MAIDYEKEYDNRSRIPEHPEIFARWQREAADFRAGAAGAAELRMAYGPSPRQTIDLFPAKDDEEAPLILFIHGGWWRSLDPAMFSQMAKGPNSQGISVAVVGYDFCPQVTIAAIIEELRAACLWLWRRKRRRFLAVGHSAGGHLAACMLAQSWTPLAADAPNDLVPSAYAISGVFDLSPLPKISVNEDLRLDDAEARKVSPLYWKVPPGRALDAVVGSLESNEFLRQTRAIVEAWRGMAEVRYEEIADANHFTVVDPLSDPDSAMTKRVCALARAVKPIAR